MAIVDWPAHERPREKLLAHGPGALSDAELLAIFLRVGMPGKTAVDLARELLAHFGSLGRLCHASQQEFSSIDGMGPAKYAQLHALLEVARRALKEDISVGRTFESPQSVKDFLRLTLGHRPHEVFACLFLDVRHRLIAWEELFRGTLTDTRVDYQRNYYLCLSTEWIPAAASSLTPGSPQGSKRRVTATCGKLKPRKSGARRTVTAPGWLKRAAKNAPWEIDEEKAGVVRKVFELAANGLGSKAIAKIANQEAWPVPTRLNRTDGRWHAQMPGRLLRTRAVLGEHQHRIRTHEAQAKHWQGVLAGAAIPNYYPRIISDDLWNRARASIRTRSIPKRRDNHYYNIFSGLMYCGFCGAPIHRKNERDGHSHAQLQCSDRLAGKTQCKTMAANRADPALLRAIFEMSKGRFGSYGRPSALAEIAALETAIAEKRQEAERIADAIARTAGRVQAFIDKSISLANEENELAEQLVKLREEQAMLSTGDIFDESLLDEALACLYVSNDESAKIKRAELHQRLARLVDTIWIWAYDVAYIRYKESPHLHTVILENKQLPSRANPQAKHHKPPKPRPPAERPYWRAAMAGTLAPPEPRRAEPVERKLRPLLLAPEEEFKGNGEEAFR